MNKFIEDEIDDFIKPRHFLSCNINFELEDKLKPELSFETIQVSTIILNPIIKSKKNSKALF